MQGRKTPVLSRVLALADRRIGDKPKNSKEFKYIIPLTEIIAKSYGIKSVWSKKVLDIYVKLVKEFGTEYNIFLDPNIDYNTLKKHVDEELAANIVSIKEEKFYFDPPGHDGVYGVLHIGEKNEIREKKREIQKNKQSVQTTLIEF
ncbi:MAG: hypothetical protein ACTSQY_10240 [Candidatus Odinarchaeia archaeon]